MPFRRRPFPLSLLLLLTIVCSTEARVCYLGKTSFPGNATDLSGLTERMEDGTPQNRLGAIGSAIAYTGVGNSYVMLPDRGPADGADSYADRMHFVDIKVTRTGDAWHVSADLKCSVLLRTEGNKQFVGISSAFGTGLRLDPEGIRVSKSGSFFVSDEYGPYIIEFDASGRKVRSIPVPDKFLTASPSASPEGEMPPHSTKGRQPNRGMEGLAISPDGRYLCGIMQSPLIQDGALDAQGKRIGLNIRMLRIDLETNATSEFVYRLSGSRQGVNELLAVNDHEFLVIERDAKAGAKATVKNIYRIDIAGATDVSQIASLPIDRLPDSIKPASKSLFIQLLAPEFGLAGDTIPEKIEGLAFGPDLPDGRHLLLVTTDNDFIAAAPSLIYAFAVDPDE